jgi:hypothetical protein
VYSYVVSSLLLITFLVETIKDLPCLCIYSMNASFNVISVIVFLKDGVQEGLDVWRVKVEDRLP